MLGVLTEFMSILVDGPDTIDLLVHLNLKVSGSTIANEGPVALEIHETIRYCELGLVVVHGVD
jgi:hypothetical protein